METVAYRYATSLFELAVECESVEQFEKDLQLIKTVIMNEESLIPFLTHYRIDSSEKKKVIDRAFKDTISLYVLNFLKLIIDKKRVAYLVEMIDSYHNLYNENQGIEEGIIYSVEAIEDSKIKEIERVLSQKMDKQIHLINQIDSTIIGGIKIVIKNHVIDGTVKNKLMMLKQELLGK